MSTPHTPPKASALAACCLLAAALACPPPAAAQAAAQAEPAAALHDIQLRRPMTVGLRFREITTATYEQIQESKPANGGKAERVSESWKIHLECDQDVLETTPKGSPKRYRLEFNALTRTINGRKEELLKKGTVIFADRPADESIFTFAETGEPVGEELSPILEDLFGLSSNDDGVSTDDVYGSDRPRKLSERWPVNSDKARAWFGPERDMRITALSGESTLIRLTKVDEEPCMEVGHTLSVRSSSPAFNFMNAIIAPERHYFWTMRSMLPIDPAKMDRGYLMTRSIRETMPAQDGAVTEIFINSDYETEIIPLPKAEP